MITGLGSLVICWLGGIAIFPVQASLFLEFLQKAVSDIESDDLTEVPFQRPTMLSVHSQRGQHSILDHQCLGEDESQRNALRLTRRNLTYSAPSAKHPAGVSA